MQQGIYRTLKCVTAPIRESDHASYLYRYESKVSSRLWPRLPVVTAELSLHVCVDIVSSKPFVLCVCVCVFFVCFWGGFLGVGACMHTCMRVWMYVYIRLYFCVCSILWIANISYHCMYVYVCVCMRAFVCVCACVRVHMCVHACVCTCMHVHACIVLFMCAAYCE